ncbi:shikimate dehydrogenase [Desulfovibrio inopinatus]|uniref:shikimate dehydrogenase n=1 Tax=Desulfovibrio inopinatus TaxID=102109 RepID=UPI0003FB979D|nr:shikimate dehydrogenase [Desulfovibrio inopinatus]
MGQQVRCGQGETQQLGIIGFPLGHTLSPLVHNWGFSKFGLDAVYTAWPTPPEDLESMVERIRSEPIAGLSVTIPHKTAIIPFLDSITGLAHAVGAVNTVFWRDGKLWGDNTDVAGFAKPLAVRDVRSGSALVLGAGGAALAVIVGLQELGIGPLYLANRTDEKAEELAAHFDINFIPWAERGRCRTRILVNTTPIGMAGKFEGLSPWNKYDFEKGQLAYDIVYNPGETRFLREAQSLGVNVIMGVEMFLYQALEQFRIWTGRDLPVDETRRLLEQALYGT